MYYNNFFFQNMPEVCIGIYSCFICIQTFKCSECRANFKYGYDAKKLNSSHETTKTSEVIVNVLKLKKWVVYK